MKIPFTKMHGIGNDYIYLNCMDGERNDFGALSAAMSPRHFSVGADGLVAICPSQVADAKMRMFNLDGSEGKMCGNAIRCVGKYLYDNGLTEKRPNPRHKSSSLISLTEAGARTIEQVLTSEAEFTARLSRQFNPEELRLTRNVIDRLLELLRQENTDEEKTG